MYIEKATTDKQNLEVGETTPGLTLRGLTVHLRLVDYATISYLAVIAGLLVFFHPGVPQWPYLVLGHIVGIGLLLAYIDFAEKRSSKVVTFFRDVYPFFLYTFFFIEVSKIVNILFPFWLEPYLISFDQFLFGNHPTVWLQRIFSPGLSELMAFSYWSYYILLPMTGLILYSRKDRSLYFSFVFNLSLTLYICYFSYLFLTARGPHETLEFLHIEREMAGFFDHMVKTIQNNASVSGAAFPSSHVAAVWVALFFLFRFKKWLGLIVTPLVLALSFSVVYMQYHYAVDSIAGILLVCGTYPLGTFLERQFHRVPA
ncbi:hypothetical protein GWO43_20300 [candidate division KSB1 bacterium]|nr:hypothetical protein [candidate division KSB1 bacterium]NIR71736.1 hypothetical protein [candidate division KSB1 bacterium]NIS26417.1 hypothetical protein [candidate division KSB1 bacterium]NIT73176.1 hypothetical protein [candidate division KSB1 bacterium]NIU27103.1 hypothetical protein [candidate division KSB1 bacterium]